MLHTYIDIHQHISFAFSACINHTYPFILNSFNGYFIKYSILFPLFFFFYTYCMPTNRLELTYRKRKRNILLCVSMQRTLPVSGSITGSRWIRFMIRMRIASYKDESGPIDTSGITDPLSTSAIKKHLINNCILVSNDKWKY